MNPLLKRYYRPFTTLISGGACAYLLLSQDISKTLAAISIRALCILLALKFLVAIINAYKFKSGAGIFNIRLSPSEWNGLSYITTFHSYFFPARMGNLFRATYLKKKFSFQYSKFVGLLLGTNYIDMLVTSLLGLIVAAYAHYFSGIIGLWTPSIFVIALIGLILIIPFIRFFIKRDFSSGHPRLTGLVQSFQQSASLYQSQPHEIYKFSCIALVSLLIRAFALLCCFFTLGAPISAPIVILSICLVNFTVLFSLTPGNLGVTEGTLTAIFVMVGIPMGTSLQVVALSRLTSMVVQALLGLIFSYILSGKLFMRVEG